MSSRINTGRKPRPKGERKPKITPSHPSQREPRQFDKQHKGRIAQMPSILSGRKGVEVCHVRYADAAHNKRNTGMAEKPSDMWCLPLTPEEHRLGNSSQHSTSEREWWQGHGIDPLQACKDLYSISTNDNYDEGERLHLMEGVIASHMYLARFRRSLETRR